MCHHALKRQQGIRKNEDHEKGIDRALWGTIQNVVRFEKANSDEPHLPPSTAPLLGMLEEAGELVQHFLERCNSSSKEWKQNKTDLIKDSLGDILVYLLNFCGMEGLSANEILLDTWQHVLDRSTGQGGGHYVPVQGEPEGDPQGFEGGDEWRDPVIP